MTEHTPQFTIDPAKMAEAAEAPCMPEFIPADSPFTEEQRTYLNGLFAGIYTMAAAAKAGAADGAVLTPLLVYFGSQTGTAESLSKDLKKFAATKGFDAKIGELNSTSPAELADARHLLIVGATYGEGEPADNATGFYEALMAEDCPPLPETVNFAVCGLGDSSYPKFNQFARDLDARFEALGATRAAELVTCDVDYDDDYAGWRDQVFASAPFVEAASVGAASAAVEPEEKRPDFDKHHPFVATLIKADCLSKEGSSKRVNHVEISLCGGGPDLDYQVGDALGVWPMNCMGEVDAILDAGGYSGSEIVELKSGSSSLRQALYSSLDLATITPKTAEAWQIELSDDMQILDALRAPDLKLSAQDFVDGLRPIQPRLYSISSSPKKHPGEVHLTVGEVRYDLNAVARKGVASTFLPERLNPGGALGVYVHKAAHFYLPDDNDLPIIMIGPGTGIAPFRAFLEEREMRGATGENWLFFGDQHAATDYLYSETIEGWKADGLLTKLSLAWSRDGAEKVYVQHLIEKEGQTFFAWLERGAAIYICGDASRMAADVDRAIHRVVETHGGFDEAAAKAYVDKLKADHRYQRDVY
ncbi:MAG: flavodoxin domain-containing protein [Pseudomonadota bacterium]